MKRIRETILILLFSVSAFAGSTTDKQIDSIHASGGNSLSVPSTGSAVISNSASQTLTNKTIAGDANTLSKLPVSTQIVQEVPSGTVNGSNTAFTLSFAPPSVTGVDLTLDGLALIYTTEYTISGSTITMVTAPSAGQKLYAEYSRY